MRRLSGFKDARAGGVGPGPTALCVGQTSGATHGLPPARPGRSPSGGAPQCPCPTSCTDALVPQPCGGSTVTGAQPSAAYEHLSPQTGRGLCVTSAMCTAWY